MPVVFMKIIYRSDLKLNPNVYYVFGDNQTRSGYGGQAREMRNEPNAIGIRTKVNPSIKVDSYWSDDNFQKNCDMIDEDLVVINDLLIQGNIVVFPSDGKYFVNIGTGLSELPKRAPRTYSYLENRLKDLWNFYGGT